MQIIDEKSGVGRSEAEALLSAGNTVFKKPSVFSRIKYMLDLKKSKKLLEEADICKVLDENQK